MTNTYLKEKVGGKGNFEMFTERESRICAAGLPSSQPNQMVKDTMKHYNLTDVVNALIGDALYTSPKVLNNVYQKDPKTRDMRNAGMFSEGSELISPPVKTKFETLVEDFKNTAYNSYWNKEVGKIPDPVPSLPREFKIYDTTTGKKTNLSNNLYEIIMPTNAFPDMTPCSKEPGFQVNRYYCSFNPNNTFGQKSNADPSGKFVKCCLNNDKSDFGISLKVPMNETQAKFQETVVAKLGEPLIPNKNITRVPEGFTFGALKSTDNIFSECLENGEIHSNKELLNKCLEHLNTLRKFLAKRFDGPFFNKFYLNLKYLDDSKCGWLQKQIVYYQCNIRYIRFNPLLIEPLLKILSSFKDSEINYKMFIRVINFREPFPKLPKIHDSLTNNIDFRTTNGDIGNFQEFTDKHFRAGIPSGRYYDKDYPIPSKGYCEADLYYLPDETDMKTCLCPSIFTLLGISHRDMYARRESAAVRRLFEKAGERLSEEKFIEIWEMAKKLHSQEWVCYETFRRSLNVYEMKQRKDKQK